MNDDKLIILAREEMQVTRHIELAKRTGKQLMIDASLNLTEAAGASLPAIVPEYKNMNRAERRAIKFKRGRK
jgi:hypothetical protein